jgi:adhesin transport system membrane fusion protein
MSGLDRIVDKYPLPTWRLPALVVAILLASAVVWAAVSQLEEVSVATGEVVPQGQIKLVQHLEGGIIEDVLVQEGEGVKKGQSLVLLDLATVGIDMDELRVRLDALNLKRARLLAEATGSKPDFPPEAGAHQPDLMSAEINVMDSRRAQLDSEKAVFAQQITQRRQEIKEISARIAAVSKSLELSEERFALSKSLVEDNLVPRLEHLELYGEVEELRGTLTSLQAALPRIRAGLEEMIERERGVDLGFQRQARAELGDVELEIARINQNMQRASDQEQRTVIVSPTDGVVKNLRHTTSGGVIRPGEPIMEIVPIRDRLVVEVQLDPRDIGHVRVGQKAVVKVSTYDYIRYGGLEGTVSNIGADATTDRDGNTFFKVFVETDRSSLGEEDELPIIPGMQATVDIHTGEKPVLTYLIQPVLKLRHEAFRER